MKKIALDIVAMSHSVTQSHNYAIVLSEVGGKRRLPIVIGAFEAQAIAVSMEGIKSVRPLTHDLSKNILEAFNVELKEVIIKNLLDGIFYALLICEREGEIIEIDARTSDALALAVRFGCGIYTYEHILEAAGVVMDDDEEIDELEDEDDDFASMDLGSGEMSEKNSLKSLDTQELQNMLEEVLLNEDYEKAAHIRDELNNRK